MKDQLSTLSFYHTSELLQTIITIKLEFARLLFLMNVTVSTIVSYIGLSVLFSRDYAKSVIICYGL